MHGVAPHLVIKGARPSQSREAGGRSPGFIYFGVHFAGVVGSSAKAGEAP